MHSTAHDATVGEHDRKQKFRYYEHAQDHYGDYIQGLIWSVPTRSAAEEESEEIVGADPRS